MNPPSPTPPQCILISGAVDLEGMRGCHKKLWENVWEATVKIENTNTMTKTWGKTKTKTGKDKKVENKRIIVKFRN